MASQEEIQKVKQYEYRQNSNLVLTSTERAPRESGPSGEVVSLRDQFNLEDLRSQMGSRALKEKPPEFDARLKKAAEKREQREEEAARRALRKQQAREKATVLSADVDSSYRPQSKETKAVYEVLLNFIQQELGDKPHDVLRSAADEILSVMKRDVDQDGRSHKMLAKKKEVEALFHRAKPLSEDRFSTLVNTCSKLTDYTDTSDAMVTEEKEREGELDEEHGVPVVFEDEGDEGDKGIDEINDEDEDNEDGQDAIRDFAIEAKGDSSAMIDEDAEKDKELDARDIGAQWLQRELAKFYKEALKSLKMSSDVFELLSSDAPDRDTENKLVQLLDYDKFDLIKLLLRNRTKIVWCIKRANAKDDKERDVIEAEMMADDKLRPILEALHRTSTAADRDIDRKKELMKEVAALSAARKSGSVSIGKEDTLDSGELFWNKRPKTAVDLESLAFAEGGHFMSNKEVKLPQSSEVINKKGYQEVHIPPTKAQPVPGERVIMISELPKWAQKGFAGMEKLNRVQSRIYETALNSPENMLLCAPTGAGKTNCAMLTILREIGLNFNSDGSLNKDAFKIIYVAPMKSLVQEMVLNFSKRLEPFGVTVRELSGDAQLTKQQINETQLIVTTPEKWDIITRKAGDRTYTQVVSLVIIDEIHLLHDSRGPVLESIVTRTLRQIEQTGKLVRLVGLSATLPNYEDVAMFLRVKFDTGLFFFDNSYRPVPLQQQYIGITQKKAFKRHEIMNQICYEKVIEQAGKNQVLIFVHSRKETATTARALRDMAMENGDIAKFVKNSEGRRELLQTEAEGAKNESLKDLLPNGFAIHHAGMTRADRTLVEELFADQHIQVLVSTSTLAWGVNLPAHTVIIKGTQVYNPEKGRWMELSPMDVMQMMGRAGRPQYDTSGEGIIITTHKELHYYLSLLNEQLPVESQFISRLADNMNAEIVLGAISNMKEAVEWLRHTYLYVRMLRNPALYGCTEDDVNEQPEPLEQRRVDLVHAAAVLLDKNNLIKYDRKSGQFQVTDLGRVASHYYISHQSMAAFNDFLKPNVTDIELLRIFSLSSEFQYMTVREEEKLELAKLLDKVPIPVKESIEEPSAKVNVLLQAYISRLTLEGFALISDMVYITQSAGRVMRALFEIVLKRGWASAAVKTLNLCKMIAHRMWGAQSPLRQFKGIPPDIIKRIEGKDFVWDRFYDLEAHAIGELIRFPKMGRTIHKAVHQLPRLELQGHVQPITRSVLRVELILTPDFQFDDAIHGNAEPFWVLVEDVDGETILHHEYFVLSKKFANDAHTLSFTIPISDPMPPQYFIRVISDRWLGSEVVLPVSFRHLILPERYAAPNELLDLQPIHVNDIASERFISFYEGRFEHFNPIQTQTFNSVYKRDDNVMVAAPTGSGKTVLAELAIMRALNKNPKARCVYIAPLQALVDERYADWSASFGKLGIPVTQLTGETTADLKLLSSGQIVLSTPQTWDVMSRRWKTRKDVQTLALLIVDEMHLIGGESGPVLEVVVSRTRFIATQTETPTRIVGLSTSVANAKELGEWIGAKPQSTFAFQPNVRPVPLEIRVQGFDINHFESRLLAMAKPAYQQIKVLSPDKPVIIFVPSRKQAQSVAGDLLVYAASEKTPNRFLHVALADLEPHLKYIKNKSLLEALQSGVGFYHKGLTDREKAVVSRLFSLGAIQVLVSEFALCWGMSAAAQLVVLMDTQYYDGREHRYVDIPITDVMQMMGRASRPLIDTSGKFTIFCQSAKKEFYKKFLYEPFPVESHLDHYLADHINAEIVTKRIETVQDAVDYLTWSFYYRRITQNPNYYNLQGTSHRHLSDHLSEMVESVIDDLAKAKCINVEDETELSPLNLGMIAAYYYLRYTSVELFSSSLKATTRHKGLLEILTNAAEFDSLPVRHREDLVMRTLSHHLPLTVPGAEAAGFSDSHIKANILLQAFFSRADLSRSEQLKSDLDEILPKALSILQAIVDVISSNRWLEPALAAMDLSQMVTQGLWNMDARRDSPLLQLPHINKEIVERCEQAGVTTVTGLIDLEDAERSAVLAGLSKAQLTDIATMCNNFPDVQCDFVVENSDDLHAGSPVKLVVTLTRDPDDDEDDEPAAQGVRKVSAPRYPQIKTEGWWLVLGDKANNELLSIKRVALKQKTEKFPLLFDAPAMGTHNLHLYLICDSYIGVDQDHNVSLKVLEAEAKDASEEEDSD